MSQPQLVLLYHFFHPDEVISARLFSDLAEHMARRDWRVVAMPAARLYGSEMRLPAREQWESVDIQRVWRPSLRQASNVGRIINALTMLVAWTWRAIVTRSAAQEVVIIGTDPILSVLVAIPWRLFRPRTRIVHWCHDVHPEASIAEGALGANSLIVRLLRAALTLAYRRCDAIVDLGACMRELLRKYQPRSVPSANTSTTAIIDTITPWALVEPDVVQKPSAAVHEELFGSQTLGCLYSGNLGRAHDFELFLTLARAMRHQDIGFCFAGRGARMQPLKDALVPEDSNIRFAGFAEESQLNQRLQAGDVHMVSLQESWTGTVVPSKFFGALAIGRPILFVGSAQCAIAHWIQQHEVGWHLTADNLPTIVTELNRLAADPAHRETLNLHCQSVYHAHFSKAKQLQRWCELFGRMVPP